MATSKMPEIPTDIRALVPKKKCCVVPGPRYGNSQQVGSCWGRQGRQAPGQDLRTPTLAAYRDQSSALPFKFCCLWTPVLRAWQLSPQNQCQSLRRNGSESSPPTRPSPRHPDCLTDPISRAVISLPRTKRIKVSSLDVRAPIAPRPFASSPLESRSSTVTDVT